MPMHLPANDKKETANAERSIDLVVDKEADRSLLTSLAGVGVGACCGSHRWTREAIEVGSVAQNLVSIA